MPTLPTLYQQMIHISRYSRWIPEENRRETWEETVKRYFDFFQKHLLDTCDFHLSKDLRKELELSVLSLEIMPSMRCLMTAGNALEKDAASGYNCSFLSIDTPRAFDTAMYLSMCGVGVGFSVERQYVSLLPTIPDELYNTDTTIVVEDSKIGWSKAFKELVGMLYIGQIPKWDLLKIRPAGSPLKTFGGRSAGSEPLNKLFKFVVNVFKNAVGRKLQSIECHDIMCMIGEIVVAGGKRRSALISLSNVSDDRMREAKSGQWWLENSHRALANNSACFTEKPDMGIFFKEWYSLYTSRSGERGIFNLQGAKKHIKETVERRDNSLVVGTNPCVTGETLILTSNGYVQIGSVVGKKIKIWNGFEFSDTTPFSTGYNQTLRVTLSDGSFLDCTPYHKFILKGSRIKYTSEFKEIRKEAKELCIGDKLQKYSMPTITKGQNYDIDAYSQGFYSGDGLKDYEYSYLYNTKYCCEKRLIGNFAVQCGNRKKWTHGKMFQKTFVPINGNIQYCLNWLAGLIDSDGCATRDKNGNGIQISSIDKDFLLNIKLLLSRLGVRAKVVGGHKAGLKDIKGKLFYCQNCYRILVGNCDTTTLLQLGLQCDRVKIYDKVPDRDARQFVKVVKIEKKQEQETFCFSEPLNNSGTFNGIVTGNCGEVLLRNHSFCNLSEVVIRCTDKKDDIKRKIRLATILGTFQSTLTDFRYIQKDWKKNCEEERLLGVSLTGIMDNNITNKPSKELEEFLNELKQLVIVTNEKFANKLKINAATACTAIKPSGTVSSLVNSSSGIHARYSKYYIRSIRMDNKDPVCKLLKDAKIPNEPDCMNDSTTVFLFPMQSPNESVLRNDLTAIQQLEMYLLYKNFYTEHTVSVTITVKESEWLEVGAFVYKHFNDINGVSFLPHSDSCYKQAPYQECTKEEYNDASSKMPKIVDWAKLKEYETQDSTTASKELACTGNSCEII